jgi:hypothetical protein
MCVWLVKKRGSSAAYTPMRKTRHPTMSQRMAVAREKLIGEEGGRAIH